MGAASNFRAAKFTDSSELAAPKRIRGEDRPGSAANFGYHSQLINPGIYFIFMKLASRFIF